jgi:glycosyltransferase involved in cell wall biosynthesis
LRQSEIHNPLWIGRNSLGIGIKGPLSFGLGRFGAERTDPVRIDLAESGHVLEPRSGPRPVGARILVIVEDASRLLGEQLAALIAARETGYDVQIAAGSVSPEAEGALRAVGLALHRTPTCGLHTQRLEKLRAMAALDQLIRALKPDLLHCIGLRPVLYGGTLARLRRLPAVLAPPGLNPVGETGFLGLRLLGFALGGARATIVVRAPEHRHSLVRARVLDPRRATFLLRGAAADLVRFAPPRQPKGDLAPTVLVSPEGLDEGAQCVLTRALQQIRDRGMAARFMLAPPGPGRCMPPLRIHPAMLERDCGLRTPAEALAQADLFCFAGETGEGIPQSLVEAAASGRALIAPDRRGCREVVRPGVTGWLFTPGDAAGLAFALERSLLDAAFRQSAGARARELAQAEFSQDSFLTAALTVYRAGLIAAPHDKRAPLEKMT